MDQQSVGTKRLIDGLYSLHFYSEGFSAELAFDRIAVDRVSGDLLLLSFVAPGVSAKAVFANVCTDTSWCMRLEERIPWNTGYHMAFRRSDGGYVAHRHYLGYGTWHYVLVSKRKGFLPSLANESLWQELQSDRYTTPLLRQWMPALRDDLLQREFLERSSCVGCECGILSLPPEQLDAVVQEGLSNRTYLLEAAA